MAVMQSTVSILQQKYQTLKNEQMAAMQSASILQQNYQTLEQDNKSLRLQMSQIQRRIAQKGLFDHDSSLSTSGKISKPKPRKVAKHYGWNVENQEWNGDKTQYCMVKYGNQNSHRCEGAFLNPGEGILDSTHTVPVGVAVKYDFLQMFKTTPQGKPYKRIWNPKGCECALLLCGAVKDLYDLGAIILLPKNPLNGKTPLVIWDSGALNHPEAREKIEAKMKKQSKCTKNIEEVEQLVSRCVGMELRWPDMKKIPYIRNIVEHAYEYYCGNAIDSFQSYTALSESLSVDIDYHHKVDE